MARVVLLLAQVFVVFLILLASVLGSVRRARLDVDPEVYMNTSQLISSKGYPVEEYDVITADGYILGIQRIPRGRNDNSDGQRPVVFLQHGLLSCSACFVENLVNESLGFMLADAGFDVWLGNSRGNTYAKRHKSLKPDQKEFWEFTWDEMAKYDIPATVDRILSIAKVKQLFFVGHSQGGAVGLAQLSNDPALNSKIKLFVAMAPAAYLSAMKSPLRYLAPFSKLLPDIVDLLGPGQFMPKSKIITWFASEVCDKGLLPEILCSNILFIYCGYDFKEMNETRIPVYSGQNPAGTSVRNIVHFAQTIDDKNFGMFDFGPEENMEKYNQTTPPQYDVTKVTVPVAMYTGTNDWLVSSGDVDKLASQIRNLVRNDVIDGWEHLDFVLAMNAPSQVYNDVISLIKQYT